MPFDNLLPQPPLALPAAQAYASRALELSRAAAAQTRCVLDIPYGDHPQQQLDLYLPDDELLNRLPVVVLFHGGRWTHGYKAWMGLFAPGIVRFPAILVSADYRLAPDARFPTQAEDAAAAVAWVHRNIKRYGGNPERIVLGGHSSGGTLAALIALRTEFLDNQSVPAHALHACFPISATYDLNFPDPQPGSEEAGILDTLFTKWCDAPAASPLNHVAGNRLPFFLTWGDADFGRVMRTGPIMAEALAAQPGRISTHIYPGFDHFTMALELRNPDGPWIRTLRDWLTQSDAANWMPE